ncbi:MAG: UbiX family flavin prenyltransferase [Terriglobia bacterium]
MGIPKTVRNKRIILGVTGASGAVFARRTLQMLEADPRVEKIHLVISASGLRLLRDELDLDISKQAQIPRLLAAQSTRKTECLRDSDIGASIASGSYAVEGMVVIPCTTGCLGQIAGGISDTLIERAADVCLKQGHKLILAVRDAPFNRIHLENMLRAQLAGAVIFPIIPTFYHRPKTLDDLVTQFCCRVLALLDLEQMEQYRWEGDGKRGRD